MYMKFNESRNSAEFNVILKLEINFVYHKILQESILCFLTKSYIKVFFTVSSLNGGIQSFIRAHWEVSMLPTAKSETKCFLRHC